MKEFDSIPTGLPYQESPDYVEQLVMRCKDAAKQAEKPAQRFVRPWIYAVAGLAAAAAVAVSVFLWPSSSPSDLSTTAGPIDTFLASLSDEEVDLIIDWSIDDIPEYE